MHFRISLLPEATQCVLVLHLLAIGFPAAARSVTDDTHRTVTIPAPAMRIVSLAPHATELLYSAGAGARIVGTVQWSDYPAAARRIPRVGDTSSLDMERIMSLRPNLVVAWLTGNGVRNIERLRSLGIPVYVSEPDTLDRIGETIGDLGSLAGTAAVAEPARKKYQQRLESLRRRFSGRRAVSVFYQIWDRPLFTVNGRHMISAAIRLCGGRNVFSDLHALSPQVSEEAVIAADPEVIVGSGTGSGQPAPLDLWRHWPKLTAVRLNLLYDIPPELIQRDSARILDGAEQLCGMLDQARQVLTAPGR